MSKRILPILALVVASTTGQLPAGESMMPKPAQNWIELKTTHFRFFSNAGRSETRRVALDLEELRAVLAELTDYDLRAPIPTFIYVFKSEKSFLPYKTLYQGRPSPVSGYFIGADDANFIAIDASAQNASATVYHEYVHYVANNNLWNLPAWFSEGLAQFYETFEVVDDTVYIGLPALRHLVVLRGAVPIPLAELFAVDHNSALYNEADRKGIFYSQSWALVHYLLLGNDARRSQVGTYLELVRHGVPENEAFTAAFSVDYTTLEKELRGYLRNLRFPWIEVRAEIDLDKDFQISKMSYPNALYRLGELLANHLPERPESSEFFERAVELDPDFGAPISALAVEAEKVADWERARLLHQRAAAMSPRNATVLFRWGDFLSRRGGPSQSALAALRKSIELDPTFAPAWAALARVYADAGDASDEALHAARQAWIMRPSHATARRELLRLYLRRDDRNEAVALIDGAMWSEERSQAEAWTLVIEQDLERVRRLTREDRLDEAKRRLDLADKLADRSLYPGVTRQNIEWSRRSINEREAVGHFDHAQELFAQDDREGAKSELGRCLAILDDGPVATSARQLLELIEHPEKFSDATDATFNPSPTPREIEEFNRLVAAKELDSALEFLEAMRGRVGAEQEKWLNDRIGEIHRTINYNRFVDEYNRAVELYNNGRFDDAARVLGELIEKLPNGRESESARALLADAVAAGQAR